MKDKLSIDEIAKRPGSPRKRVILSRATYIAIIAFSLLTAVPLLSILLELIFKGARQFNFSLFTEVVPTSMEAMFARQSGDIIPGGILNGITGTIVMLLIAIVISTPLGLLTGIFLAEKKGSKLANIVRMLTDVLQGVPSIVWGIVVYMLVVQAMHRFSALAGGVALGFMMIPMIIRSTEEGLLMLPPTLKEAGLALGGSHTSVMFSVILPSAFGSIFTGVLLAISRVMGETAPLLVTALGATYVHWNITEPMSAISLLIWEFYNDPNLSDMVWASSLLLLLLMLVMNLLAKSVAAKWRI